MEHYKKTVYIDKAEIDTINAFLAPHDLDHHQGEDETITKSVEFGNGMVADIKCCGVKWDYNADIMDGTNTSWTEMVLFKEENGVCSEVACTEVCDTFLGIWGIEYDGDVYSVDVHSSEELYCGLEKQLICNDLSTYDKEFLAQTIHDFVEDIKRNIDKDPALAKLICDQLLGLINEGTEEEWEGAGNGYGIEMYNVHETL